MSNIATSNGGIGFVGLLTIVFITLKLIGSITWSWLWVLAPLWISFFVSILIIFLVFTLALLKK